MTVGTTARVASYTGNGITTSFSVPFQFFEIDVYNDNELVDEADYTITQTEPGLTGSVGFLVAPGSGDSIVIVGNTNRIQDVDYVENNGFPAETHERALDRLTMVTQELARNTATALRNPVTSISDPVDWLDYPMMVVATNEDSEFGPIVPGADAGGYLYLQDDGTYAVHPHSVGTPAVGDLHSTSNLSDVANAATAFGNIKQAATTTATGVVELATSAETTTGTDTVRATTPAGVKAVSDALVTAYGAADAVVQAAALAADKLVLLNSQVVSGVTDIRFTSLIAAAYDEYMLSVQDLLPATDAVNLFFQVSTDNGATWKTTSYVSAVFVTGPTGSASDSSATGVPMNHVSTNTVKNTAGYGWRGNIRFWPNGTTARKHATVQGFYRASGITQAAVMAGGYWDGDNSAVNAVRIIASSGNISGTVRMYGLKNS